MERKGSKIMIYILVMIVFMVILLYVARRSSLSSRSFMVMTIFILGHSLIFTIDWNREIHRKLFVFSPSIAISIPTLIFIAIYIRNKIAYLQNPPGEDSINEDFMIVFVIVGIAIFLSSFLMSILYWFLQKKRFMNRNEIK
ncbi:MAG TPA: hypothetical protein DEG42_07845 [Acholeplasmataceae bacterium]|nr:MAG: hypothetical protein A2Y43_01260 [Tenericutes bacterium GWA2_38_26]OHE30232.1 MAG: hypothetical protein A2084_03300 [Tenericutes bacterium GWC2_39_45]OHE31638.1 MAG: hypothetical protein A2009_01555 [Tenericutes bacterium GWD2_38_27]OHE35210.1 MAG: hypothetical protein A2013_01115 [Tenericutes bacterium GWE2_38_8]OHE45027.1 MAG: hypothetical protein A2102_05725 [Tenericutes bacterium GWF2_38_8]HBG32583.1 hypothetical protein [Acholeplasmataceae bacterium]